jgi:AcrR family transcriptional regulator
MKGPRNSDELEKVREDIIDASLSIITEEGLPSLTMRKLAARMHMSAPNLYNYFMGKDEIYITIIIKGFWMLKEELEKACSTKDDPAEQGRAMLETYVRFGITNKAYYDIMFTRPTPKYNDYVGTPYEKLSEIELNISVDIARIAMDALSNIRKKAPPFSEEETVHHIVKVWCLLHGMVSLSNSNIIGYVAHDRDKTYSRILSELVDQYRVT